MNGADVTQHSISCFLTITCVASVILIQVSNSYPTHFSFQHHFFGNLTEFSMIKATQNSISPATWVGENSPNQPSVNPTHKKAFQKYQECG